ncbi:hypothetical protein IQ249_23065 [Lusitaniella coriacea LEGE 07157]|uniref:Uncharacterized protein n=1 Tax=Lusitaniella coriacea LEGE 07157 TaxID=945747 RepID=A0A8J7E1U4_9CYAN|nr:hypothetical protein [Lusitaniella coriacea]MBE9118773.1 hypothetical protein [Lusitaniella coriacea LEGE 07157]
MDNLESFQTLLEVMVLILTLFGQSPWLGIAAAVGVLVWLLVDDELGNGQG